MATQSPNRPAERPVLAPRVDILESESEFLIAADLPGVPESGVRLHLDRNELTLEASTQLPAPGGDPLAQEFGNVEYRRAFVLPRGIDTDGISARLEHGVLRVRLPRSTEGRPRRIEVHAT